jgi:hypothetical protein
MFIAALKRHQLKDLKGGLDEFCLEARGSAEKGLRISGPFGETEKEDGASA